MPRSFRTIGPALLLLCLLARPAAAQRWREMDYGPFLTSSVTMHPPTDPETVKGVTVKAITVKLKAPGAGGKEMEAAVCFDTNLLCYTAGWQDGWLKLMGTPFDGTHRPPEGSRPAVQGTMVFEAPRNVPGWAKEGKFDDPRSELYVPLPKEWAHYKGLYVHGDHVIFSYTVGGCDVLDMPDFENDGRYGLISRTLRIGPSTTPLELLAPDGEPSGKPDESKPNESKPEPRNPEFFSRLLSWVDGAPPGSGWTSRAGRRFFSIAPHEKPVTVAFGYEPLRGLRTGPGWSPRRDHPDPATLIKGGPARYPKTIETQGKLGPATGDAPYVVDTLTLPDDNSWKAWMRIGGFDFYPDGKRAAVCTWSGDVWIVRGIDDKLERLTWRRYATGLFQPLGLKIVDDQIYVLGRDQVTRLHDLNADGEADFYENFNNDISVTPNFHEFVFDLETGPGGDFFFTKGAPLLGTDFFDPIGANNGCVMRLSKDGKTLTNYATGLRAPNGAGAGPNGEITCSDNQGIWTPACRINLVKEGNFLGCIGTSHRTPQPKEYDPPLCWLPMGTDNSSGDQVWVTGDKWGPFAGEMLHLSYGKCTLFHVLRDEAAGVAQGGVVRFPLKFDTGIMRSRFNPADGQLYVAGLKGWQTDGARDGAFHRVRYTGKPVRTVAGMRVTKP